MFEKLTIYVLVDKALIEKHTLAILPDEQRVTVLKSTLVAFVKLYDVPANEVFKKPNTKNSNTKNIFVQRQSVIDDKTLKQSSGR